MATIKGRRASSALAVAARDDAFDVCDVVTKSMSAALMRADPAGCRAAVLRALTACATRPGAPAVPRSSAWVAAELMYSRWPLDATAVTIVLTVLAADGRVTIVADADRPRYVPAAPRGDAASGVG